MSIIPALPFAQSEIYGADPSIAGETGLGDAGFSGGEPMSGLNLGSIFSSPEGNEFNGKFGNSDIFGGPVSGLGMGGTEASFLPGLFAAITNAVKNFMQGGAQQGGGCGQNAGANPFGEAGFNGTGNPFGNSGWQNPFLAGGNDNSFGGLGGEEPFRNHESPYTNFTASSTGDPHLAVNSTNANGMQTNAHWDDMRSHRDLLSSNDVPGGYRVSTQATEPNGSGVTMNGAAEVTTNNGNEEVSMNASGAATINDNGTTRNLTLGTPVTLSDGTTVLENADQSVTVTGANRKGGSIATTMKSNGQGGVDLNMQATNVHLGGYLTHGQSAAV